MIQRRAAVGEAFNIGDAKPPTQVEMVEKMAKVSGRRRLAGRRPRRRHHFPRRHRHGRHFYFREYFDLPPIAMNIGKVKRVLKMNLTPFETRPKETCRWYVRNHKPRTSGFEFGDKLLALAKTRSPASM